MPSVQATPKYHWQECQTTSNVFSVRANAAHIKDSGDYATGRIEQYVDGDVWRLPITASDQHHPHAYTVLLFVGR
jgi:hypothetical protein